MATEREYPQVLTFLNEKFTPNLLPEVCAPRRALMRLFDRAAREHFIFVGAQAGSGKTVSTLLWLNTSRRRTIWLGLDAYDNTPAVFYKLLATGLYSSQPENRAMRAVLTSPDFSSSPVEYTVRLLAELLPDDGQYVLVLDDMHLITNGEICKSLPAVLRRLPRSFVTVILSRGGLPEEFLPLIRSREVSVIPPEALRFTEDEIRQYFGSLGRFLTPDEAKFAFMATDGWAIGVNAVAQSGQLGESEGEDGSYVFARYFESQIWDRWPSERREFCLRTSVVNEFDPELARRLTGREDAETVMEELSRTNTFLSRLHGDIYRYHHLFQDFLRDQLARTGRDVSALYKTAANYYKEQHDYSRALRFWLDSEDYKGLDTFLYLFLFENHRGVIAEYADFMRTIFAKELPDRAYREFPALHIARAWYAYLISDREEFESHMDAVYRNLPRIALAGDKFMEYAILAYSVDHRSGIREKIREFHRFGRYVKVFTAEGLATSIASFTHNLPYFHRSNLDYSDLVLDPQGLAKAAGTFGILLGAEWKYLEPCFEACFAYEQDRLEDALAANRLALEHLTSESKLEGRICVYVLQHTILRALGRVEESTAALYTLDNLVHVRAEYFLPNMTAYRTKLQLCDGDRAAARAWLDNYFVLETDHVELYRIFQHFTTARACLVLGEIDKARRYLDMLRAYGRDFNRPLDEAEALVLSACLQWATGDKRDAVSTVETAIRLVQPYGFTRIVAEEGAAVVPILKRLLAEPKSAGLDRAYVNDILLTASSVAKQHRGITANLGRSGKPVKLSRQQMQMILLLAQGCRNAEIATRTGLSLPTVKSHISAAYHKLEVNNAIDAVLKARALGLIE